MKVLFADALSESAVCALREMGCEITINADLKAEDLAGAIGDHEILVVRSTKVNAAAINSAPNLALIIRLAREGILQMVVSKLTFLQSLIQVWLKNHLLLQVNRVTCLQDLYRGMIKEMTRQ